MKNEITIVVVTCNRLSSLSRLLYSLENANYRDFDHIRLVISIDGGGPKEVESIARDFVWNFGEKEVIVRKTNLGLRKHIIQCGNLTQQYGDIILLEDDIFVSPEFCSYTSQVLGFYRNVDKIAGVSLYAYRSNEYAFLPFETANDGNDICFMQIPSSWGQVWTKTQWQKFMTFYNQNPTITVEDKLPDAVKDWPESSWKKYFYKYMVDNDLFFVYPQNSYSTNFADIGTHMNYEVNVFQVPLVQKSRSKLRLPTFENSNVKYDAYFEILPKCLKNVDAEDAKNVIIDLYGLKQFHLFSEKMALSAKPCKEPVRQYGIEMLPFENNIAFNLSGNYISYAPKENFLATLPDEKKTEHIKKLMPFSFGKGYEEGIKAVRATTTYRIANKIYSILKPFIKIYKKFDSKN